MAGAAALAERIGWMYFPTQRFWRWVVIVAAVAFLGNVLAANAHGPCPTCVEPARVSPGDTLTINYPTYKAILNPTRRQLTLGPKPNCYGCLLGLWKDRVRGVPSVSLGTWRPPRPSLRLDTPAVPTGRYLIALFDGSEGGTHYTWDFVSIDRAGGDGGDSHILIESIVALIVVTLVLTAALWRGFRR
jgi:hypothetical protein